MKKITLAAFMLCSISFFAQELPKGWDIVTLNGKTAYMNMVTGAISTEKPTKPAEQPKVAVEVDPSIRHKVEKGETLYSISKKYNISVDDIYSLNTSLKPESIRIGQEIVVGYDKSKEGEIEYKVVEDMYTNPSNNTQHFVKKGETLYSIAKKHGLTVDKLKKLNNLTDNTIEIGQKLMLQ